MKKTMRSSVSKKCKLHRFYLIEPKPNADADSLAERLICLEPVEEVFLSDGDYGFLVKVRFYNGEEPRNVVNFIRSKVGGKFGTVDSYYHYKK